MTGPTLPPADLPAIAGFQVLNVAGRGGMGIVYRAQQLTPRRLVALKLLSQSAAPAELQSFQREAQTIAALEHPYIVPLYAFGEHQGRPFLVLRYLGGGTVGQIISRGPIPLANVAKWILAVAEALDFAHRRGVVHRDVKPSNILLDETGNAYLSDFGIAAATASGPSASPIGSAAYMSPEQGRGEPLDGRSDLYSLSAAMFEMLTGRKPYEAETTFAVIVRHINDPIPSARQFNPQTPVAIADLIQWGMAKSPDERPGTIRQFSDLLKEALANPGAPLAGRAQAQRTQIAAGAAALPPAVTPVASGRVWRWAVLTAVAAMACLAIAAIGILGGYFFVAGRPTAPPSAIAQLPTPAIASSPPEPSTPTQDPDGGVVESGGVVDILVKRNQVEWLWPVVKDSRLDGIINATISQATGPAKNEMGLFCRWQDNTNAVVFMISGEGEFRLLRKSNGTATELIPWTPSSAIVTAAGAPNSLALDCTGPKITAKANGTILVIATDPAPSAGQLGVMAGLRQDGQFSVQFSDIGR